MPAKKTEDGFSSQSMPFWLHNLPIAFGVILIAIYVFGRIMGNSKEHVIWNPASEFRVAENNSEKLRLFYFGADWCLPCEIQKRQILENSDFAKFINENFMAIRVTDRIRENGRNSEDVKYLEGRYKIHIFPTLIIVGHGHDGKTRIHEGFVSAEETYRFLLESINDLK